MPAFCGLCEGKDLVVVCPAFGLPYNRCSVNWRLKAETRATGAGWNISVVCMFS